MISTLGRLTCGTALLVLASLDAQAVDDYKLIKKSNDITLFSFEENENSLPTIQAHFTLSVQKSRVLCLLKDASLNPLWVPNSLGAIPIKSPTTNESWVVFKTKMPFPFKNRDVVISFRQYEQDDNTTYIKMLSLPHTLQKEIYPVKPDFVRTTQSKGSWLIESLSEYSTRIVYENYVDLGGKIPLFLVRAGLKDVTFKTAVNFINLSLNTSIKCHSDKTTNDE